MSKKWIVGGWVTLCMGLIVAGSDVIFASAAPTATSTGHLDTSADPRLQTRVSLTAYRATVGRVLSEVSRITQVTTGAGSAAVRNEPIQLFVTRRPLAAVLNALAEEFAWSAKPTRGWFWAPRTKDGAVEYGLYQDLPTQKAPGQLLARDRRLFAEDLAGARKAYQKSDRPGAALTGMDVVAVLPDSAVRAALEGKHLVLPWPQLSEAQRHVARALLGRAGGAGEDTRMEVSLQGDGNLLNLYVFFGNQGRGGAGLHVQPSQFQARTPERREINLVDPAAPGGKYNGLAARGITLDQKEREEWSKQRSVPALLALLSKKSGADIVCDDYDYGVYWSRGSRVPAGEPLGFWLDALASGVRTNTRLDGCRLEWRESNGFILIRNADWITDDALRPPTDVVDYLRNVREGEARRVLTLPEGARLRTRLNAQNRASLTHAGLLPKDELRGLDRVARLLEIVTPAQRARLFSARGLSMLELNAGQVERATAEYPGSDAIFSDWVLRNQQGGDMTIALKALEDSYEWKERCPQRPDAVLRMDLRLPDADPEVLRVALDP